MSGKRRQKRRKRSILKEGFLQVAHGSAVIFHLRGAACRSRRYGSIVFALLLTGHVLTARQGSAEPLNI